MIHDMNRVVGRADILLVTLDTLRHDVAERALSAGATPHLARRIGSWQRRHAPGSFTYSSHHAMFAGFLPTPASPGPHPRLFALDFAGSKTTAATTAIFDAPDIVSGLAAAGYHTVCIGGVGFFNKKNPLGRVLPGLFAESHWDESLGVTDKNSARNQVNLALSILEATPGRIFLFVNISALHQPNCIFVPGATTDTPETQGAALAAIDEPLARLFAALERRGPCFCIVTSDHGTAYGEDGHTGHRLAHDVVWTVPYADFSIGESPPR